MGELLGICYVLPCSFKSPHGYACMERILKIIDLIDKLILIPFKSPHGYAWLEDTWIHFKKNKIGILLISFKSPNGYAWLVDIQISRNKYTTNRHDYMVLFVEIIHIILKWNMRQT